MFQRDPVAIVLGRDVAQLIHRIIHREALKEVNAEYHRRIIDDGAVRLDNFPFNWRQLYFRIGRVWDGIYHKRCSDSCHIVAALPKNY